MKPLLTFYLEDDGTIIFSLYEEWYNFPPWHTHNLMREIYTLASMLYKHYTIPKEDMEAIQHETEE